jgi:hypothetical protein
MEWQRRSGGIPCPARLLLDIHRLAKAPKACDARSGSSLCGGMLCSVGALREIVVEVAQNPVTRLWTGCTRLKINQIKSRCFR